MKLKNVVKISCVIVSCVIVYEIIQYADKISPMGNASSNDCAKYCISLFSDYTRMVTMQNLFHDGGFSKTGVSQDIVDMF